MLAHLLSIAQSSNVAPTTKPWIWKETVATQRDEPPRTWFGARVVLLDDLDGDGTPDLAVSSPRESVWGTGTGCVYILSGTGSAALASACGSEPGEHFGTTLARTCDVDGDGHADVIAGSANGRCRVISSRTGLPLEEFRQRGAVIALDLDGDGIPDYVREPIWTYGGEDQKGLAVSGCDDHELYRISMEARRPTLAAGEVLCELGDLDGDGTIDFAAGLPGLRECKRWVGGIRFFSGRSGVELRTLEGRTVDGFAIGAGLSPAGDVDHDGYPDLISSTDNEGPLLLVSGRTGQLIRTLTRLRSAEGLDTFAETMATVGDIDHDGTPDIALGSVSSVQLFSGRDGHAIALLDADFSQVAVGEGRDLDGDGFADFPVGLPEEDTVVLVSGSGIASHSIGETLSRKEWPVLREIRRPSKLPSAGCPR